MGRIRGCVTKKAAVLVYNTIILSIFDYCDIAWSSLLQQDQDRLQRLQNRSARIMRSVDAMEGLRRPVLALRRSYHKVKLVFLCLQSLVPGYFLSYFSRFSSIHRYNTRHSNRLSLPMVKRKFGKNSFIFSAANLYNNLPSNLIETNNLQVFTRLAKLHFFKM